MNYRVYQNSGLRFTNGNDPEIFPISIMEKVLDICNSGTITERNPPVSLASDCLLNNGACLIEGVSNTFDEQPP